MWFLFTSVKSGIETIQGHAKIRGNIPLFSCALFSEIGLYAIYKIVKERKELSPAIKLYC